MIFLNSRWRWSLLLLYGWGHAFVYLALLPLWEGYDEPFHYGYVQHLVDRRSWPVSDVSPLSREILEAWKLSPVSPVWERQLPELTSYREYFALPEPEQWRRRLALERLPVQARAEPQGSNYEAQQPPLAYLVLAPVDYAMREAPLLTRVLWLRGCGALLAVGMYLAVFALLGRRMSIPEEYLHTMAFCFLSLQNVYGSVAHIANDWLSLPLILLLFLVVESYWSTPGRRTALAMGAVLAAGLLAKSYFLVFVPVVLLVGRRHLGWVVAASAALAGPWYWRNLELYGSLSGLQEAVRAVSLEAMLTAAARMNWPESLLGMARAGLWTSNNSFGTYSADTLNVYLILLAGALGLWVKKAWRRRVPPAEWILAGGTALFAIIPLYAMVLHGARNGQVFANANPWHTAGLLPGLFLLAAAGCGAQPGVGRWVARGLCLLSLYLLVTTYFVKLFPLYAGYDGAAGLASLYRWYGDWGGPIFSRQSRTALWGGGQLGWATAVLCLYGAGIARLFCQRLRATEIARPSETRPADNVSPAPQRTLVGR